MAKPRFNKKCILNQIKKTFPNAEIISSKRFEKGLVSSVYQFKIKNPKKELAVKIYKVKNKKGVILNNKIISFLYKKEFPVPKIYSNSIINKQGVVVMELLKGNNANEVYKKASPSLKKDVLYSLGELMRKFHKLKIQKFWEHPKHPIKTKKEWINFTKLRVRKYLKFVKENLEEKYYKFLKKEFNNLIKLLGKKVKLVPLHWDFHFDNILINKRGQITGIFDFENSIKGDYRAELGQFWYWLRCKQHEYEGIKHLVKGYGKRLNKRDWAVIKGYIILHLAAVTRSIWKKQPRLSWIIEKHYIIIEELMKFDLDKFLIH